MQIANTTRARYARGTHERDSGKHVRLQLHHSPVMHVTITRVEHIFLETYLLSWSCNKKFYGCNWLVYQRLNVTDMCHWNVIDLRKKRWQSHVMIKNYTPGNWRKSRAFLHASPYTLKNRLKLTMRMHSKQVIVEKCMQVRGPFSRTAMGIGA